MFLERLHIFFPNENMCGIYIPNLNHQLFHQANERYHFRGLFFLQNLLKLIVEYICSLWYNLLGISFFLLLNYTKNEDFCNCNRPHFSVSWLIILIQTLDFTEQFTMISKLFCFFALVYETNVLRAIVALFIKKIVVTANREHLVIIRSVVYLYRLI